MSDLKAEKSRHLSISNGVKEKLQQDKEDLTRSLGESRAQVDCLTDKVKQREEELRRLQVDIGEGKAARDEAEAQLELVRRQLEEMKEAMRRNETSKNKAFDDLAAERDELQRAKDKLEELTQALKHQLTAATSRPSKDDNRIKEEISKLRNDNLNLQKTVGKVQVEREELAEASKRWQADVRRLNDQHELEMANANVEIERLRSEVERLRHNVEAKEREIVEAKTDDRVREQEYVLHRKESEVREHLILGCRLGCFISACCRCSPFR